MKLHIFSGGAHPALAMAIAEKCGVALGKCRLSRFPDTELTVEVQDSVRGGDLYIVQPTSPPVDQHLIELLFLADACLRAGAGRVTAVVPYLGYARQDRRANGREAIGARLVAELMGASGLARVIALDLHVSSLEGFFGIPLEHLSAIPILAEAIAPTLTAQTVILAPDLGAVKLAERYSRLLRRPIAFVHKERISGEEVRAHGIAGDVRGRPALVIDDMISTGGTIEAAVKTFLADGGAADVSVVASHGLLVGPACHRLRNLPIKQFFLSDSVPVLKASPLPLHTISVAPLLAEAIVRLHNDLSMNGLIAHA